MCNDNVILSLHIHTYICMYMACKWEVLIIFLAGTYRSIATINCFTNYNNNAYFLNLYCLALHAFAQALCKIKYHKKEYTH